MAYLIAFLIILAVVGLLFWMFGTTQSDREYLDAQKERLEDDRIYDPETGAFYTMEEIEQGIVHEEKGLYEPFSDEEIEIGYFNDQEFPLAHNQVLQAGYKRAKNEEPLVALFESNLYNYFDYSDVIRYYDIGKNSQLLILQCNYRMKGQYVRDTYFFGVVVLNENQGHYVLRETNSKALLARIIDRKTQHLTHKNWTIECFDSEPDEGFIEEVVLCFPNRDVDDLEIIDSNKAISVTVEVKGKHLFFMVNKAIDQEQTSGVLMCLKNLESTFSK